MLAGVILVVMNRFSIFHGPPAGGRGSGPATASSSYVFERYDPQTGRMSGKITAETVTALADGTADCANVLVDLPGTTLGDVTLTCDKALVKLEEVGKKVVGRATLSGAVTFAAVREDRTLASGHFEKVSYDAATKDVSAEGPLEVRWGDEVVLSGTDLSGNAERSAVRLMIARDASLAVKSIPEVHSFLSGGGELKVTSAGPMAFDLAERNVSFSKNVRVTRDGFEMTGEAVQMGFSTEGATRTATGELPLGAWSVRSLEVTGPAHVTAQGLEINADNISWDAGAAPVVMKGSPVQLAYDEDRIEAETLDVFFSEKGTLVSAYAGGAGKAVMRSLGGAGVFDLAAGPGGPVEASWKEYLEYNCEKGTLVIAGDVAAASGDARVNAAKITMDFEPGAKASGAAVSAARQLAGLTASGKVTVAEALRTIRADLVAYSRKLGLLTFEGEPAVVTEPEGTFESRSFSYATGEKVLTSQGDCRLEAKSVRLPGANGGAARGPVVVSAKNMSADFSGETMTAKFSGGVFAESGDGKLSSATMEVSGVALDRKDGKAAADRGIRASGEGEVLFEKEATTARGDSFAYDEATGAIALHGGEGRRVEVTYGDEVAMWGDSFTIDSVKEEAVCLKPKVSLSLANSFMGLFGEESKTGKAAAGASKVYVSADGRMTVARTAPDKSVLTLEGNVQGVGRDAASGGEDSFRADKLSVDMDVLQEQGEGAGRIKARVTAARASGNVYLKYSGPKSVLEGSGEGFSWERASNQGRLTGTPAVVWQDQQNPCKADELTYDFSAKTVSVRGGREGALVLER